MSADRPWEADNAGDELATRFAESSEILVELDVLPDGREALIYGDLDVLTEHTHRQGENILGFLGTCGLCSCQDLLCQFGLRISENDLVLHAVENEQCTVCDDPSASGGTTSDALSSLLTDYGIPAHTDKLGSLEDLAANLEQDRGVIVGLNAGVLWEDANYFGFGESNHAVVVVGLARDPQDGGILGFYVNDTGVGSAGQFVAAGTIAESWLDAGGHCVVTDVQRSAPSRGERL